MIKDESALIPDLLPTPLKEPLPDLKQMALDLYRRVAESDRRLTEMEEKARDDLERQNKQTRGVIAQLAAERFEFERLVRRIVPGLEGAGLDKTVEILNVHARGWDQRLRRVAIEVVDLTGETLTDELAEVVEVESAIPVEGCGEAAIQDTLAPLVRHEGRTVGLARVITRVPAEATKPEEEGP